MLSVLERFDGDMNIIYLCLWFMILLYIANLYTLKTHPPYVVHNVSISYSLNQQFQLVFFLNWRCLNVISIKCIAKIIFVLSKFLKLEVFFV